MVADDYDDIEAAIPATTLRVDMSTKDGIKVETKEAEIKSTDNDKQLMPPPSIPLKTQTR